MSSRVLVVGGAGYVGSHTVLELLQKGFTVIVVDNLNMPHSAKPEPILKVEQIAGKKAIYYDCNIEDEDTLFNIIATEKIDSVIHLASAKNFTQNPLGFYRNDVGGSLSLLAAMKKNQIKKLVFSSSAYVYGEPDSLPVTEDQDTGYRLPHILAKAKHMIEEALKDLCKSDQKWSVVVLRHVNPAGAHESGSLGETMVKNEVTYIARHVVLNRGKISISRDEYENNYEGRMMDYVHVGDVATAYVLATIKAVSSEGFKVYNLGSQRPHCIVDVIERISVLSGKPLIYEIVDEGKAEPGFYLSSKLAEEELGWKRKKNLDDICRDTLRWVIANPKIPVVFRSYSFAL